VKLQKIFKNNSLLNDQWVIKDIRGGVNFLKFLESNGNTTYQNLWDTAKEVQRGKFIDMSAFTKKEIGEISNKQCTSSSQKNKKMPKGADGKK
jgi:hypothetical protein